MPTDPTPGEPTPGESSLTDRNARDRISDAAEGADSDSERNDSDPDGDRVAALERRVTELEAELEAVRGLLDGVEAVGETVEQRADAALAKVEALEDRFEPEDGRLVRERLPDAGDGGMREGVRGDQAGRQRDDHHDTESDPDRRLRQTDSRIREGSDREAGRRSGSAGVPGSGAQASKRTVGGGRTRPAEADTTEEGSPGTGAISSVRADTPDAEIAAEDAEQSLAARLRDAFR